MYITYIYIKLDMKYNKIGKININKKGGESEYTAFACRKITRFE